MRKRRMILIVMITGKKDNTLNIILVIIKNVLYDTNIIHYG